MYNKRLSLNVKKSKRPDDEAVIYTSDEVFSFDDDAITDKKKLQKKMAIL